MQMSLRLAELDVTTTATYEATEQQIVLHAVKHFVFCIADVVVFLTLFQLYFKN